MSRRTRIASLIGLALPLPCSAAPTLYPFPLPFNADIVQEVGGVTTRRLGFAGEAFVTQSYAALHDADDPKGVPDDGRLVVDGIEFQLGPYDGNNALRLAEGISSGAFSFPPTQGGSIYLLVVAGDARQFIYDPPNFVGDVRVEAMGQVGMDVGPAGRSTFGTGVPNYLADGSVLPAAIDGMDTTGPDGSGFLDVDDAALFWVSFPAGSPSMRPSTWADIYRIGPNPDLDQHVPYTYVLAATLVVPEPSAAARSAAAGSIAGLFRARRRTQRRTRR